MSVNPIIPVIDYTSRDYEAIRSDMIRLIRQRVPEWGAEDPNDFGVALVEAFAYATDQLHYYLDRVANESYLGTATQRESVMSIASMFGYQPYEAQPASVSLLFGNSTGADITLPAGSRVQATLPTTDETSVRTFETVAEVTVARHTSLGSDARATMLATEGRSYRNEQIGISDGTPFQRMFLPRMPVIESSVDISVVLGGAVAHYRQFDNLEEASDEDRAFVLQRQTDGSTAVIFGDSYNGEIPALHGIVVASYRVGGGNVVVPANSLTTLVDPPLPGIEVTNPDPSSGGRDAETLDSIRMNAIRMFRTPAKRAVTLDDFAALAKSYPGITKAKAVANNGVSVTVYAGMSAGSPADITYRALLEYDHYQDLMPPTNRNYSEIQHKFPDNITITPEAAHSLQSYLQSMAMAGVSVTVIGPLWMQVFVELTVQCRASARQADVKAAVEERLQRHFSFAYVNFDNRLTSSDLAEALREVPGVEYVNVEGFGTDEKHLSLKPIHFVDLGANVIPWWDNSAQTQTPSLTLHISGGR